MNKQLKMSGLYHRISLVQIVMILMAGMSIISNYSKSLGSHAHHFIVTPTSGYKDKQIADIETYSISMNQNHDESQQQDNHHRLQTRTTPKPITITITTRSNRLHQSSLINTIQPQLKKQPLITLIPSRAATKVVTIITDNQTSSSTLINPPTRDPQISEPATATAPAITTSTSISQSQISASVDIKPTEVGLAQSARSKIIHLVGNQSVVSTMKPRGSNDENNQPTLASSEDTDSKVDKEETNQNEAGTQDELAIDNNWQQHDQISTESSTNQQPVTGSPQHYSISNQIINAIGTTTIASHEEDEDDGADNEDVFPNSPIISDIDSPSTGISGELVISSSVKTTTTSTSVSDGQDHHQSNEISYKVTRPSNAIKPSNKRIVSCVDATYSCRNSVSCSNSLKAFKRNCNQLILSSSTNSNHDYNKTSICSQKCLDALVSLKSSEIGQTLVNCDCQENQFCLHSKKIIGRSCEPRVDELLSHKPITSCSIASLICQGDSSCFTALEFVKNSCATLILEHHCTSECYDSLQVLNVVASKRNLANCRCDGHETFPCEKYKNYAEQYCDLRLGQPNMRLLASTSTSGSYANNYQYYYPSSLFRGRKPKWRYLFSSSSSGENKFLPNINIICASISSLVSFLLLVNHLSGFGLHHIDSWHVIV